jgi:hypothetical protein
MKITEFRTAKFKNIIKQIAEDRGATSTYKSIKFFTGTRGETRSLRINGTGVNDVIAVYYTLEDRTNMPHAITYSDYLQFSRDIKVGEVLGEVVAVKDFRNPKVEPDHIEVGKTYLLRFGSNSSSTSIIRITKKTKTTATYETFAFRMPVELAEQIHNRQEYSVECDIKDVEILGVVSVENKLRAYSSGSWKTSAGWGAGYLDATGTAVSYSRYND